MSGRMTRWRLERRLRSVVASLAAAREELEVAQAQHAAAADDDVDWGTRSLVSERTADRREAAVARHQAEVLERAVERARAEVTRLEAERDELLAAYPSPG